MAAFDILAHVLMCFWASPRARSCLTFKSFLGQLLAAPVRAPHGFQKALCSGSLHVSIQVIRIQRVSLDGC